MSGLQLQASTGTAGYALVSGAGTILSWTAPDDGNLHRALVMCAAVVTSAQTGGQVDANWTSPGNVSVGWGIIPPASGTGWNYSLSFPPILVAPGTTLTVTQEAMSAGAVTVWAEIWGL